MFETFSAVKLREQLARAEATNEQLRERLDQEAAERQRLIDEILQMKREGFAPQPPNQIVQRPLEDQIDEKIVDALDERAARGSRLWNEMGADALDMLRRNADVDDVVAAILRGGNPDNFE